MAGAQSPSGLRKKRRTGLSTVAQDETRPVKKAKATAPGRDESVASKAQQTHNVENADDGDAEPHAARLHDDRTTPRAIKSASEAANAVARIMIENMQRGSDEDLLETGAEDFNAIDNAKNERCEDAELDISRETMQREPAETQEGEAKHGAEEEASNTAEQPEAHETNIQTGGRRDMAIQKKEGKHKSSAHQSKETSKINEAVELEVLDECAMIYSLADDPDPQVQQCYAYYQERLKDIPVPNHIFRSPCMPCTDLFAEMDDDTETGHICEKQGTGSAEVAANVKCCKSCASRRGPCKINEMPVPLRGISKLMSEANFYFHDANHRIPFPPGWAHVKARYSELRGRPDVGFVEVIKATNQCSVKVDGIGSQMEGQESRIIQHMDARFSKLENLMQEAIAPGNGPVLPIGSQRADMSELEKMMKRIEAQEEEIRHLRAEGYSLSWRIDEWRDKYWGVVRELRDARAVDGSLY